MFNVVDKTVALPNEAHFSVNESFKPDIILAHLTFYWITIVSKNGDNPTVPSNGRYRIYFKINEQAGWEEANIFLDARFTGGILMPDGLYKSAYFSAVITDVKVVPENVVGADSYDVYLTQSDRGSHQPNTRIDPYGITRESVISTTQTQALTLDGTYFVGTTLSEGRAMGSVVYSILTSGDYYLAIDGIETNTNVDGVTTDGTVIEQLQFYFEPSNGNSYTYTPSGDIVPAGRSLNVDNINDFPTATLERGITDARRSLQERLL